MQEKKKASLVLSILSIVLGLPSPIVGLILGIGGLVMACLLYTSPSPRDTR